MTSELKKQEIEINVKTNSALPDALLVSKMEAQTERYAPFITVFTAHNKKIHRRLSITVALFAVSILCSILSRVLPGLNFLSMAFDLVSIALLLAISYLRSEIVDTAREERLRSSKNPEIEEVYYLTENLAGLSENIKPTDSAKLTKLLPKLTPQDSYVLTARHMSNLRGCLSPLSSDSSQEYISFQIAILKSFELIGGRAELSIVRSICGWDSTAYNLRVVEAARKCLPLLSKRVSSERNRNELLRPSSSLESPNSELLLPANDSGSTLPEELLRSSNISGSGEQANVDR